MPSLWFPLDEIVGDRVDQARKRWEELTGQVSSAVTEPLDMDIARKRWDELTTPILDTVRQGSEAIGGASSVLNPIQAASGLGRTASPGVGSAVTGLDRAAAGLETSGLEAVRRRWDELTGPIGQEFGRGFEAGERGRVAAQGGMYNLSPDTPAGTLGQSAAYVTGNARDTLGPIAERSREAVEGVSGMARGAGLPEPVSRGLGLAAGALGGVQGAVMGSTLEGTARAAGLPEPLVQANRIAGETLAPTGLKGDVFGNLSRTRLATTALGAAAGAGIGAVTAEDTTPGGRTLGGLRGGLTGLQVGSSLPDLASGAARLGRGIRSTVRAAPRSADLLGAPLGAVLGYNAGPEDQSPRDRAIRTVAGAVLGPGFIRSARGLIDLGRTLDNLSVLRVVAGDAGDDLSPAERIADTIEYKLERYNQIEGELGQVQERLGAMDELARVKIEQPSYQKGSAFAGRRLSEGDLYEIAERAGVNPQEPGWWQKIDPENVRLYRDEAVVRRGPRPPTPKEQAVMLRRQERALRQERRGLEQQLEEHYNRLDQAAPGVAEPPTNPDQGYESVRALTFRPDKPPTGEQDLRFTDAGWQRVDNPDGSVRYENPRFRTTAQQAAETAAAGAPGDTERVRTAIRDVQTVRENPDLTPPQKQQAVRDIFDRHPDLSPEEKRALRQGVPRQRPSRAPVSPGPAGPAAGRASLTGPVPPPRQPEAGRVVYPEAQGLQPQSAVPVRPEGVAIPPGTRELGEGSLPTGGERQPPLGDIRRAAVPPVRPGGGDVPPAPEPEGVGVMAPRPPAGTPQMGMAGMPPTREGTVYPERVAGIQPPPEPEGVGVLSTPRSSIEPPTRVGSIMRENAPPSPPAGELAPNTTVTWQEGGATRTGRFVGQAGGDVEVLPLDRPEGTITLPRSAVEVVEEDAFAGTPLGRMTVKERQTGPNALPDAGGTTPRPQAEPEAPQPAPTGPNAAPVPPNPTRPPGVAIMATPSGRPNDAPVRRGSLFPEVAAGIERAPDVPDPPLRLSAEGRATRERMIQERLRAGDTQAEAELGADAEIRLRRDLGTAGKDLRQPHWSDSVGDTMRRWNRMRYIGILANPVGGVRDALFTAINIPVTYARIAGASGIERGFGVNPRERSATFSMLQGFDEGMAAGFRQGLQEFIQVMRRGDLHPVTEDLRVDRNLPLLGRGPVRERAAAVLESTYRLRQASDRFYTTMGNRMASTGLAYREAERAGFTPGTLEHRSFVERTARGIQSTMDNLAAEADKLGQRVPQGTVKPRGQGTDYEALAKEAFQISRRLVYQQDPGSLTGMFGSARGVGVMSTLIPLYRTIANMGAQAISHHPVVGTLGAAIDVARSGLERGAGPVAGPYGFANAGRGSILTRTGSTAVLPLSQRLADSVITGGAMAAAGAALMAGGVITGTGPADASVRRRMQDEGWRPLSVVTERGYIPIGQLLGPLALPLAFGATLQEQRMKGGDTDTNALNDFVRTLVDSQQSQWFQQSGLRDFYETFNALGSPDPDEKWRSIERLGSSVFNQWFAPGAGFGRFLNSLSDGSVRDPRGVMERWAVNYPGLSGMVPERTTETGAVVTRGPGERGVFAALPVQEISRIEGPRRYYGSTGADMDAEITRAINAVNNNQRDPTQYRAPSQRQLDLYFQYQGTQDPLQQELSREERIRRRQRTASIEPGLTGAIIGSANRANFAPPGS